MEIDFGMNRRILKGIEIEWGVGFPGKAAALLMPLYGIILDFKTVLKQ